MSNWLKVWTPEDVQAQRTHKDHMVAFANYVQQQLGSPYPTNGDFAILRGKAKQIFDQFPHADWRTLCKIVRYCKSKKKRPPRAWMVLDQYREAWSAGFAPELDFNFVAPDIDLDAELAGVLLQEEHPSWRRRLVMAQGLEAKKGVLSAWQKERQPLFPSC
jgi:hypothetical protein